MKIEALTSEKVEAFIQYCKKYKGEIDESYLYDEDLRDFEPNEENPTYIVTNDSGNIIGTVSLIIDAYNRSGKKGRFRIFHSETENKEIYQILMESILGHVDGLENIFVFVPEENKELKHSIEALDFQIERYSFLLVRDELEVPAYHLPIDYEIKTFQPGKDEQAWCEVRNASFATLKGSETPITPDMVTEMTKDDEYLEGGLLILYHNQQPVGVVKGSKDEFEGEPIMNIGPVAVIPEYQGKGLGRILLRASLHIANEKDFKRTILCVNADNERAKSLYIQEGFKQVEAVACYNYSLI
ncbi:mycothiol synthase [Salirhabdus euzebyi]|uniref:Mycothiol synthase n=1 Tax=Salirhabdus euzebyi TaxID=394506 RepID=A0A841Q856_9BACI|nr:GNAT family N-acetyltransferase [Salirhabdus euzebyi]MBB6454472.1 mycothiol synthase [Salirhabdus euzebyi]